MAHTLPAHFKECNGYSWAFDEKGAHYYTKKDPSGKSFLLMRCLPEDLENGNFEYFAKHNLTNENKK